MKIGGFQQTSLIDYPDTLSAIIWTVDCNFHCPFCYNPQLVHEEVDLIPEDEILSFLDQRKTVLEGLVISGGEPLLQEDIEEFIRKVKHMGYLIKIDTNGTCPTQLRHLLEQHLVDYVAMDVKAPKDKYMELSGANTDIQAIQESIDIIKKYAPRYEFRTTVIPHLLSKEDIVGIAGWLEGADYYYLQQFKTQTPLLSSKLTSFSPYSKEDLVGMLEEIRPFFKQCDVRGV
jgi:pyruvate formate lyase activating enzyme